VACRGVAALDLTVSRGLSGTTASITKRKVDLPRRRHPWFPLRQKQTLEQILAFELADPWRRFERVGALVTRCSDSQSSNHCLQSLLWPRRRTFADAALSSLKRGLTAIATCSRCASSSIATGLARLSSRSRPRTISGRLSLNIRIILSGFPTTLPAISCGPAENCRTGRRPCRKWPVDQAFASSKACKACAALSAAGPSTT
jgi:hypothetical protein